jgi:hypothetical protein
LQQGHSDWIYVTLILNQGADHAAATSSSNSVTLQNSQLRQQQQWQ